MYRIFHLDSQIWLLVINRVLECPKNIRNNASPDVCCPSTLGKKNKALKTSTELAKKSIKKAGATSFFYRGYPALIL